MVTKELYKLTEKGITKDGHTMFEEDIVKDLNDWRNHARDFRNKNAELLKEIGGLKYGEGCRKFFQKLTGDYDEEGILDFETGICNKTNLCPACSLKQSNKKEMEK